MNFYPAWPPFVGFAVLFFLAATPPFAPVDLPLAERPGRNAAIDGARGYLALSVLFYHGSVYHDFLVSGRWAPPPASAYGMLATFGVGCFFMITAFLFWGRVIDGGGRLRWRRFFVGRLFRLAPVYLVAIAAMVVLVFEQAGWRLRVSPGQFARELAPWLALGLFNPTELNDHPGTMVLTAGVTWSLRYEWLFYAALPLLAALAGRGATRALVVAVGAAVASFAWFERGHPTPFSAIDPVLAMLFAIGMLCAAADRRGWSLRAHDRVGSLAMLGALAAIFLTTASGLHLSEQIGMFGVLFFFVASGCSMFGVLTHRASKRLGDVSYGIYLLQGLVLATVFQYQSVRRFACLSPARHWVVVIAAAVATVVLAAIVHVWVERPGMALGRRVGRMRVFR